MMGVLRVSINEPFSSGHAKERGFSATRLTTSFIEAHAVPVE
jgi:hypothetical protein